MRPALAVAIVSSSLLAAEIVLTRLFALWFRASYAYLIVAGATCGMGFGAFLAQAFGPRDDETERWVAPLGIALAASLILPVTLVFAAALTGADLLGNLLMVLAVTLVVFAIGGSLLAALFRANASTAGELYAADLGAAACGVPVAFLLLEQFGATGALLALSATCAGVMACWTGRRRALAILNAVVLVSSLAALTSTGRLSGALTAKVHPPESNPLHPAGHRPKELFIALSQGSELVRTDWSALARSDVVLDAGPRPAYRIFMDGAVPTPMEEWEGDDEASRREYAFFIGTLPYRVARRPPERVLALGSGGGLDVVLALANGAREVEAVDVNPALPRIAADPRFRDTSVRVYADPRVRLLIEEGRSHLRRAGLYDLIYSACALTNTLPGVGAGLVENHLYTIEAFQEYWRHLTPEGLVALVVEDSKLADRLLLTALLSLSSKGVSAAEAPNHVLTAQAPDVRIPYRHVIVVNRAPWQHSEARALVATLIGMRLEPKHVPYSGSWGAMGGRFDPGAPLQTTAAQLEAEYLQAPAPDLWPVTDDRPFFIDFGRGLDPSLASLFAGVSAAAAAALLAVLALGRRSASPGPVAGAALCFACLGVGFMAAETALIQRLGLLLGSPTYALAIGLGALLAGGAVGSGLSQRLEGRALFSAARIALAAIILALAFCRLALPGILQSLAPFPTAARIAGATALVALVGVPMGVPFAAALRLVDGPLRRLIPALWGLNGIASLLGGVAAIALAKFLGYGAGLMLAIVAYALAWPAISALGAYRLRATDHAAQ